MFQVGVEQLFNQLMRPKLRTLIPDVFKDVSYILDEDSYATAEHQDLVRKRFVKTWEGLVDGYKVDFMPGRPGRYIDALHRMRSRTVITARCLASRSTSSLDHGRSIF